MDVLDTLKARGFFHQCTDEEGLKKAFAEGPVTFYCGFDPTADSLHAGGLVQLMLMAHLTRAGHKAVAVVGGGTVRVGDPSGRDATREMLDEARIARNKEGIRKQIARFCEGELIDNAEWLLPLNYIDFLRDVGSHFSVNRMLSAESVKLRLERGQGLSFIEFNYVLLQAYDFLELNRRKGVLLQVGGADQWFNIVSGIDLIRRLERREAFGLTTPLLTTATGAKMGKTAAGAVWLDAEKVSPFDYAQYWYNCDDRDVERFLKLFTFLPLSQIQHAMEGDIRLAKRLLADEATAIVHGRDVLVPEHKAALPAKVVDLLVGAGLATSKSEARRLIQQGGVHVDDAKIADIDASMDAPGTLKAGKKKLARIVAEG